jgi:hypothetical protein
MLLDPCLAVRLRRSALFFALGCSSVAFAQTSPVFPVLTFEAYPVTNAVPMADGDVNGDGAVDTVYVGVVAGPPAVSTLTTALRSKTGGAAALVQAGQVGCTVNSVTLVDLNKDGKLDAVATCSEGTVAVLQGNGDGSFQAATTYSVANAAKVVAGDFNGDGYPDLAVAMNSGSASWTFSLLLNKGVAGAIGFGAATLYNGATGGTQLYVGDVNGDGKLDVVAGGTAGVVNGPNVQVYTGNGDGTLTPYVMSGLGNNVALGDFDEDGTLDIAQTTLGIYGTGVALRLALGTKGQTNVSLLLGTVTGHALDVNGDGHADLVLTGSTTTILLGDGKGNLSVGRSYATPGTFYGARTGDTGKVNLVFTTPRGFYTLKGRGDGTFDGLPALFASDTAATADINGDGITDGVSMGQAVNIGRGDGTFALANAGNPLANGFPVLADFDRDGVADLVQIYNSTGGPVINVTLVWSKGRGDGTFVANSTQVDLGVKGTAGAVVGDFDGDGNLDVVVSYVDTKGNTSGLVLARGNGDGTFIKPAGPIVTNAVAVSGRLLAADLNGDGRLDLVWGDTAYLNQAGGTWKPVALPVHGTAMAVGDLDGDGIADVVIDNAIYSGNGDGTFKATALYTIGTPAGATNVSAAIGDLNGDGHADVLLQYMADMAGVSVVYGDGRGGFTADSNVYATGGKTPVVGLLGRLNNQAPALPNDGRLDYVVFADGAAVSLLNQTNPAPTMPPPIPSTSVLSVSPSSVIPLNTVQLSLKVTGVSPLGTVTFTTSDGAVLGKVTVQSPTTYLYPKFATPGTYTVTATYSGDANNSASVSNPVTITVAKGQTTTSLILLPQTFSTGVLSMIEASVSGSLLTGQVTFSLNGLVIGTATGGLATLNYRFTTPGTYQLVASYSGDASNLPSTSQTVTVTVVPGPDFSITVSPMSNTVKAGGTATYTITVSPINGYIGVVTLTCQSCSGPPYPLTVISPNPASVPLTLTAPTSPPSGGPRALTFGVAQAGLLLLMGWGRRGRRVLRRLPMCVLAVGLAIGLGGLSGCSSGSSSQGSQSTQPTTYNVVIVGSDNTIAASHSITLQLTVTQ